MATHPAVVTTAIHGPLEILQVPTIKPSEGEVRVRVQWTASTPLDLHQNDGGLLVQHPQVLGDGIAGTVVEAGPGLKHLAVGDKVFGFGWREQKEKAHQEFATLPEILLGKLPPGFTLQEAVTLPNNFATVFNAFSADLRLPTPWPKLPDYIPPDADSPVLIWGGASSVGQYALQILRYYGYRKPLTTASRKHHSYLKDLGAMWTFDYNDADVVEQIVETLRAEREENAPTVPQILDCIGSQKGSVQPISKLARKGAKVAILLPVIMKGSTETTMPEYMMDVEKAADWAEGVEVRGVRTHFYLENAMFRDHLQSTIMPTLLAEGIVKPNAQRIIEGESMLERAQNAMDALRRKEASGERLVWRVADD